MTDTSDQDKIPIGRLNSFGVRFPWQVALLLPRRWQDLSDFTDDLRPDGGAGEPDRDRCFVVRIVSEPKASRRGPPRTTFRIQDAKGVEGTGIIWGGEEDAGPVISRLRMGQRAALMGKVADRNNQPQLTVTEWIDPKWLQKQPFRPVYPSKTGVIGANAVRDRVIGLIPTVIPAAARALADRLSTFGGEKEILERVGAQAHFRSLEAVLWQAHLPDSVKYGEQAHQIIERLAALDLLDKALSEGRHKPAAAMPLVRASLLARANALPFHLTDEQMRAVEEILEDLRRPLAMNRLVTGDVGTGKTAVYGLAVAVAADAGARVSIMLPGVPLATQVFEEMKRWWPDMDIHLVKAGERKSKYVGAQIVIGTTAILTADIGPRDLVVVDEQQKFSREQREQLADCHLLEVSATSIPRTQALVSFGVADLSRLTKGHADKTLYTKIHQKEHKKDLFQACLKTVEDGSQLAIVYPSRDETKATADADSIKSAVKAVEVWEKHFPGRVRLVHGQMKTDEKAAALADMKEDRADVLISTTVIEVGLTLPRLRRLMVVDAERYGLTQLHQLRGRLARHGGEGHFDLYLSRDVPDTVQERLTCLEKTTDGFELAEMDLRLRGHGELTGAKQHGDGESLLIGRGVDYDAMAAVAESMVGAIIKPDPIDWADSAEQREQNEVNGMSDEELDRAVMAPSQMSERHQRAAQLFGFGM